MLPTATWYEKNDLNTCDMHPFIHPLSAAVDPAWQSRSDWEIYKGIAKKFSEVCVGHLGVEKELVLTPLMHDTPAELAQPLDVKDWKKGECELIPGKTAPQIAVVERDYPNIYKRFTALGPLMNKVGNGGKGIAWNTETEVKQLGELNGLVPADGRHQGHAADRDRHRRLRSGAAARARDQRPRRGQGLGGAVARRPAASTRTWRCTARTRRSASATSRRSRARSSARPTWSGIESETRRATTPATPTCTS